MGGCINLAETNQDLRQSFLTAKHIFQHVKRGRVKFVFIGLTPYSLHYDNRKDFSACTHDLQYALTLNTAAEDEHGKILRPLISNQAKNALVNASVNPDLNFDALRPPLNFDMPAKSVANWQGDLQHLTKTFDTATVAENLEILKSYIKLCRDNGAKPVGVMFPFAPAIKERCDSEILALFRMLISQLEENHGLTFIDLFDLKLEQAHFSGIDTLNRQGALFANSMLKFRLFEKKLLSFENICAMKYESFDALAYLLPKETYNELLDRVLDKTVKQLRHKKKIKVGFLAENAANWCGDKLYNYFAENKRFEPTVFIVMRADDRNEEIEEEFRRGTKQLQERGLNVVALEGRDAEMPTQDIMFFLKPYLGSFPINAVQFFTLTPQTLITYIPYGFNTSENDTFNQPTIHVAWKLFLESLQNLRLFEQKCIIGAPRALYSGYPRLDVMFEEKLTFDWKMTRPDAKKIIWAPHWSMGGRGINYATFQWNFKFMYEFAKAHPEISWVVKPHPKLPFTAVSTGLFPSVEAYREYIQKWNDLPNAKVYLGAYYHAVFATSDGMIRQCQIFCVFELLDGVVARFLSAITQNL